MAEEWVERRQRAVKCPIHGLHYDPKMMSACPRCRREELARAPKQRPQVLVFLLSILGLVIVFYRMFGPDRPTMPDYLAVPEPEVGVALKLDPRPYRGEIEPFERLLFESQAALQTLGEDLLSRSIGFTLLIRQREPEDRRKAADAIDSLLSPLLDEELTQGRLEHLRSSWPRIRATYFARADWFSTPKTPSAEEEEQQADLAVYRDIADELWDVLDEARNEAARLSEPIPSGYGAEEKRAARDAEWENVSSSLQQRLQDLRERVPKRPPAGSATELMLAIQDLERGLKQGSSLVRDANLPSRSDFQRRFAAPLRAAEDARTEFNILLQT